MNGTVLYAVLVLPLSLCLHNTEHSKHFTDTGDLTSHALCLRGDMLV